MCDSVAPGDAHHFMCNSMSAWVALFACGIDSLDSEWANNVINAISGPGSSDVVNSKSNHCKNPERARIIILLQSCHNVETT